MIVNGGAGWVQIRVELPDSPLSEKETIQILQQALDQAAIECHADFMGTVETWEHQPDFHGEAQGEWTREVYTEDQIYEWVNDGTEPHWVEPVRAKALMFNLRSIPKTRPGSLQAGPGYPGDELAFSKGHYVSGIDPRNFEEKIAEKWDEKIADLLQEALDRAGGE